MNALILSGFHPNQRNLHFKISSNLKYSKGSETEHKIDHLKGLLKDTEIERNSL